MTVERHPVTGRFLAHDREIDCQEHCAGECGEWPRDDCPTTSEAP